MLFHRWRRAGDGCGRRCWVAAPAIANFLARTTLCWRYSGLPFGRTTITGRAPSRFLPYLLLSIRGGGVCPAYSYSGSHRDTELLPDTYRVREHSFGFLCSVRHSPSRYLLPGEDGALNGAGLERCSAPYACCLYLLPHAAMRIGVCLRSTILLPLLGRVDW